MQASSVDSGAKKGGNMEGWEEAKHLDSEIAKSLLPRRNVARGQEATQYNLPWRINRVFGQEVVLV